MGRTLYVCNNPLTESICIINAQDGSMMLTSMGRRRADSLVPTIPAECTFHGIDEDGDVLVKAFFGGKVGNAIQVMFTSGPTGAGNEDLPLRVDVQGSAPAWEVAVLFATDGGGASVAPTAADVAALLNTDPAVATVVEATLPGTGASNAVAAALTALTGGADTGSWLKFEGSPSVCRQIHRVEVS